MCTIPNMRTLLLVAFLGISCVYADDNQEYVNEYHIYRDAVELVQGCGIKELSLCLKERVFRYIDSLPDNLDLGGGLKIKANQDQEHDISSRQQSAILLPDDPKDRQDALDNALLDRLTEYAKSHTLEFRFLDERVNDMDKSAEEGRKKKGGSGGGGMRLRPMMMLLQLKAAALGAIALKFISLVAFKALLVAKIALTIAGIVALKKLVDQKHHSSTYEVVAHPHYEDHNYFDRSFNQGLAYKGYSGTRSIH